MSFFPPSQDTDLGESLNGLTDSETSSFSSSPVSRPGSPFSTCPTPSTSLNLNDAFLQPAFHPAEAVDLPWFGVPRPPTPQGQMGFGVGPVAPPPTPFSWTEPSPQPALMRLNSVEMECEL